MFDSASISILGASLLEWYKQSRAWQVDAVCRRKGSRCGTVQDARSHKMPGRGVTRYGRGEDLSRGQ